MHSHRCLCKRAASQKSFVVRASSENAQQTTTPIKVEVSYVVSSSAQCLNSAVSDTPLLFGQKSHHSCGILLDQHKRNALEK